MPYLQLAPPHTWEHGRRADRLQPLTGSPGVLLITTRGRPPGLTCRATGVSLSPTPWSNAKEVASTPFRAKCIARRRLAHCRPKGAAVRPPARLGAFPGVARMGGNVPAVLVCSCQATGERCFDRLSLNSPGKMPFYIALIKISLIFFEVLRYGY